MKFSVKWLKQFVNFKESPQELASLLSLRALEAEVVDEDTLDVEVTPNRPDCLSYTGLARELKAILINQK